MCVTMSMSAGVLALLKGKIQAQHSSRVLTPNNDRSANPRKAWKQVLRGSHL